MKVNRKHVQVVNPQIKVLNDEVNQVAVILLTEVQKVIEDVFVKRLKEDLPQVSHALGKIAKLDIGLSFAEYIESSPVRMCRPKLIEACANVSEADLTFEQKYTKIASPCIFIKEGYNPLLSQVGMSRVPNTLLVDSGAKLSVLNGANGSGKTTLLRMTALNLILAQIGCFVPCEQFVFTPF